MAPIDPHEDLLVQVFPMAKCLQSVLRRIEILGLKERIEALAMPERTCAVARMYALCNQREMRTAGRELATSGTGAAALSPHLVRTAQLAETFRSRSCVNVASREVDAVADLMERRWDVIEPHGGSSR